MLRCDVTFEAGQGCPDRPRFEIRYMRGLVPVTEGACGPVHLGSRIWQVEAGAGHAVQFEVRTHGG